MLRRLFLILVVLLVACNDDDSTGPTVETGTILIDTTPDEMNAPWTLQRPGGSTVTGNGDRTFTNQDSGEYKVTWGELDGLLTPFPRITVGTLVAGEEFIFQGTYWNDGPEACFESIPRAGILGEPFEFDGSCSSDIEDDNADLSFSWDWEGDGTMDETVQGDGLLTHVYSEVGMFGATLRLADRGGEFSERVRAVWVGPEGFIPVFPGTFVMGAPAGEPGAASDEIPANAEDYNITLSQIYFMQSLEVTNQQFVDAAQWAVDNGHAAATATSMTDLLDGSVVELLDLDSPDCEIAYSGGNFIHRDAGHGINPDHPVKMVTWYGAVAYCDWLTMREGEVRLYDHMTWTLSSLVAPGYRLPTEAEWEYACRAGSNTGFANGDILNTGCDDPVLDDIGWYCGNAGGQTQAVGLKIANDWNFKDMHGNVMEWCNDYYSSNYYNERPNNNPPGPMSGVGRVVRGGDFADEAQYCRSANRSNANPDTAEKGIGFRAVRMVNVVD
jgi:formylglycine-generating enzyme required for sulfatase activity